MNRHVTLQKKPVTVTGKFLQKGDAAPAFRLVSGDLRDISLSYFGSKRKILNIFPSIDTSICAASVRKFSKAGPIENTAILCISSDLPFTQFRFCCSENINNIITLSTMRGTDFSRDYGVHISDGPLEGITARAVVVLNEDNTVIYSEIVPEIINEPNYNAALLSLNLRKTILI